MFVKYDNMYDTINSAAVARPRARELVRNVNWRRSR